MAQRTTGVRAVLSHPIAYEAVQRALGVRRYRTRLARDLFRARPGMRILDVGCGPGDLVPFFPDTEYVGFDLSQPYIDEARRRFGAPRVTFHCADVNDAAFLHDEAPFDLAIALGLLHHLDDHEVEALYSTLHGVLAEGARLITVDPVFIPYQNPVARWLISKDRGLSVRDPKGYVDLARRRFDDVRPTIRTDLLRVPYTHMIMEHVR